MTDYIKAAKINDLVEGKMKEYKINGKTIVLVKVDDEILAFDGICTHAHCSLAGGYLDGYTITCYCHGAQFDIEKGDVLAPPAVDPINVYEVKVEGEDILIKI